MTIRELMRQVDVNRVVDAFILLDHHFSEENYENSFIERYQAIPKMRQIIQENIRFFAECTSNDDKELHTIFVMEIQDSEDYSKKWKKQIISFAICDKEAVAVLDKDFHVFDNEGEARVEHYGIDQAPMEKMVNYTIAQSSLKNLGKEICAAKILSELFFWGMFPKQREKRVNELYESFKNIDEEEFVDKKSFDEVMKKWDDELMLKMSEDEKAYYAAKDIFDEATEDIVRRYWHRTILETQQQYIEAIKTEYNGRTSL